MGYAPEAPKGGPGGRSPPGWSIFFHLRYKNGHEMAKYGPYQAQNLGERSCTPEYQFRQPWIYKIISSGTLTKNKGVITAFHRIALH